MKRVTKKVIEDTYEVLPLLFGKLPPFNGKVGDTFLLNSEKTTGTVRFTITRIYEKFFTAITKIGTKEDFLKIDVQIGAIHLSKNSN